MPLSWWQIIGRRMPNPKRRNIHYLRLRCAVVPKITFEDLDRGLRTRSPSLNLRSYAPSTSRLPTVLPSEAGPRAVAARIRSSRLGEGLV